VSIADGGESCRWGGTGTCGGKGAVSGHRVAIDDITADRLEIEAIRRVVVCIEGNAVVIDAGLTRACNVIGIDAIISEIAAEEERWRQAVVRADPPAYGVA